MSSMYVGWLGVSRGWTHLPLTRFSKLLHGHFPFPLHGIVHQHPQPFQQRLTRFLVHNVPLLLHCDKGAVRIGDRRDLFIPSEVGGVMGDVRGGVFMYRIERERERESVCVCASKCIMCLGGRIVCTRKVCHTS